MIPTFRRLSLAATVFLVAISLASGQAALDSFRSGQSAFQREDYWTAIDAYRAALKINPRYQDALQGLAESFFALGEYDEASKHVVEARALAQLNSNVQVLRGRILLGQMKLEEALAQFQETLTREPKHQGATFGLAEYEVMKGRLDQATTLFEAIRKNDPANLRALMSILYVSAERDDKRTFDRIFQETLKYYSSEPKVHLVAAQYAYDRRDLSTARSELDAYVSLSDGKGKKGWILQAKLYLDEQKPAQAVQVIDDRILKNASMKSTKDASVWYLRAVAHSDLGSFREAANSYRMAMSFDPENETYRLGFESLLLRRTQPEDPLRIPAAQYHFDKARDLFAKNLQSSGLDEARRGLLLQPFSVPGRLSRAEVYKKQGLKTSSLEELELIALQSPSYKATAFLDELEIQRSLYADSLSARWGLKLSDLNALNSSATSRLYRPYTIGLFTRLDDSVGTSYKASKALSEAFADELESFRSFEVASNDAQEKISIVDSFATAFQKAREGDQDYFLMLSYREGLRDFAGEAKLYLGRTGRLIRTFNVYKKGNSPMTLGLRELASSLAQSFPLRASVVKRENGKILVNLGKRDGVVPEQKFQIVRDGAVELTGDASWFAFPESDALGTWTVGKIDDWTSEGTIEKSGFFDTMGIGDEVFFVKDAPKTPSFVPLPVSAELQREILNLR